MMASTLKRLVGRGDIAKYLRDLDGCLLKHLPYLLESLGDIVRESPTTRTFHRWRPHLREDIQRYFTKPVVISISLSAKDIRNYQEMRFSRDHEPGAIEDDLRVDIVRIMLEKLSDMYIALTKIFSLWMNTYQ